MLLPLDVNLAAFGERAHACQQRQRAIEEFASFIAHMSPPVVFKRSVDVLDEVLAVARGSLTFTLEGYDVEAEASVLSFMSTTEGFLEGADVGRLLSDDAVTDEAIKHVKSFLTSKGGEKYLASHELAFEYLADYKDSMAARWS